MEYKALTQVEIVEDPEIDLIEAVKWCIKEHKYITIKIKYADTRLEMYNFLLAERGEPVKIDAYPYPWWGVVGLHNVVIREYWSDYGRDARGTLSLNTGKREINAEIWMGEVRNES